ncbi:MAG TPA: DUF2905 domain-containing protein [Ignavibacteriaceae bacterium]|nr:DUF2905 domain-containing protein [Ignavibacteriaceae bacterium]
MQMYLLIIGAIIILLGLFWPFISKLPIGKLPGDIIVDKPGFKLYIPFTTMVIISTIISLIIWLFRK